MRPWKRIVSRTRRPMLTERDIHGEPRPRREPVQGNSPDASELGTVPLGPAEMAHFGRKIGMVQILDDSSGAAGAAATHEFSIRRARTVNTFPDAK